jgi:HAE1 family hydrophobic/amphiphilic exporter-1
VVRNLLQKIPGTVSPHIDYAYGNPTITLKLDKDKASQMDVNISDAVLQLRYLFSDEKLDYIKIQGHNTYAYLDYKSPFQTISGFKNLKILNQKGESVFLDSIAQWKENRSLSKRKHFDGKKIMTVSSGFNKNTTVEEIINQFEKEVEGKGGLNGNVTYQIAGDYVTMNKSYADMQQKFMIAILLVYTILLLQFNSFSQPFAIILCVPFSIIGVALGYYLTGLTFSTLSFLGVVSLVGIAINDAIVLIDYINNLRKNNTERLEAIILGCNSRFKPIIATSLTTIAGVLPLALYSEDYSQMAYALIFGLMSSTLLTLFVVPTVLNIIENAIEKLSKGRRTGHAS